MPRKKQAESAKSRRQKLLDYFHAHARKARFISDVKNDLNIKNEQNLRRDLELLAEAGILEKSKDTSKLPARAVFTLKSGAPRILKGLADEGDEAAESKAAPEAPVSKASVAKAAPKVTAAPKVQAVATPSNGTGPVEELKGRRSARELEQQILALLEQEPTTVKDLAEHLGRQQPTVTKALERMQERRLVERKRQGRSFVYSRLIRPIGTPASAASTSAASASQDQAAASAGSSTPEAAIHVSLPGSALQSIIDAAVRAGVSAALDHIMATKTR